MRLILNVTFSSQLRKCCEEGIVEESPQDIVRDGQPNSSHPLVDPAPQQKPQLEWVAEMVRRNAMRNS